MLLLTLLLHRSEFGPAVCSHDVWQDEYLRRAEPKLFASCTPTKLTAEQAEQIRKPIRIHFDYSKVAEDVEKIVKPTLENVGEFMTQVLKVKPLEEKIRGVDCDLYIEVDVVDLSDSTTIASARYTSTNAGDDYDCGRPVTGEIRINKARMASSPQNLHTGERRYFMTIVHEVMHVVAFSRDLFKNWVPIALHDGSSRVQTVNDPRYGLDRVFISSPAINAWIRKRFHIIDPDFFDIGLEIEDAGGSGSAGSHPNERLFLSDVMQGKTYGSSWISGLFGAILEDTGWYSVNYDFIEPLCYLDQELHSDYDRLSVSAIVDPPQTGFPETVHCQKGVDYCFADYVFSGVCDVVDAKSLSGNSSSEFAKHKSWYNPRDWARVGSDDFLDHANVVTPYVKNCRDPEMGSVKQLLHHYDPDSGGEKYGSNSICAVSTLHKTVLGDNKKDGKCYEVRCRSDNRLAFVFDGKEHLCLETNQTLKIDGMKGKLWCPPAKAACAALPKVEVINIHRVVPDHGPSDGQNLVRIEGSWYDKYDDLVITIGKNVNCKIIHQSNYSIICQIDKITDREDLENTYQSVTISSKSAKITTSIPQMYIFTKTSYSSGHVSRIPSIALLLVTAIISSYVCLTM